MTVAGCLRVARSRIERPSFVRRSPTLALPASTLEVVRATGLAERLGVENPAFVARGKAIAGIGDGARVGADPFAVG